MEGGYWTGVVTFPPNEHVIMELSRRLRLIHP